MDGYYTSMEASKILGVTQVRVTILCNQGKLGGKKVAGRWFVDKASVDARAANPPKPGRPWPK